MTSEKSNITTPLSADELAAELYRRQGYLIYNSSHPKNLGDVVCEVEAGDSKLDTPLRIVGRSTLAEFTSQQRLAQELGWSSEYIPYPYFYYVEAAD